MDFQQNTQPEASNDNQDNTDITTNGSNPYDGSPYDNSAQNMDSAMPQNQPSDANSAQAPYQVQQPYGNSAQAPYQVQQPYGSEGSYPYQNEAGAPYPNGNPNQDNSSRNNSSYYSNSPNINANGNNGYNNYNNSYNSNYNNNGNSYNNNYYNYNNNRNNYNYGSNNGAYPDYNRGAYGMPVQEPGSGLATAAMILGIVSIISCFTFTVYPAFITGSIAIMLAVLSKGRRPKLFSKAKTGIICAVIGLISNTVLIAVCITQFFTNPDVRAQVNQTCVEQYGKTFDEMIEEILEDSGYND